MSRTITTLAIASLCAAASPAGALAQDSATLVTQLEPGQTMAYRSSDKSSVSSDMGSRKNETQSRIAFEVMSQNDKDQFVVDVDYPAMSVSQAAGPQSMTYDTENPEAGNAPPQLKQVFDALVAADFTVYVSDSGEIENIDGVEALSQATGGMLNAASDPTILTREYALVFSSAEDKSKASVGDTWTSTSTTQISPTMSVRIELENTLESIDNGVATISIDGTATIDGDAADATLSEVKIDGKTTRDAEDGQLLSHALQTAFTLDATMQGQPINLTISSDSSLKLIGPDGGSEES